MTTIKTTPAESKSTTRVYDNLDKCLDDRIYTIQSTLRGHPPIKKPKTPTEQLVPITFGWLKMESGKEHCKTVKILLDSGASATLVSQAYASNLHKQREKETQWTTMDLFSPDIELIYRLFFQNFLKAEPLFGMLMLLKLWANMT